MFSLLIFTCLLLCTNSHVFMDTQTKVDSDLAYGHMVQLWDSGVPCISLCHHFPSLATKLHHGKFRANGGCGFVPKPLSLRGVQQDDEDEADEENAYVLLLHVISGQELPDSVPNIPEEDLVSMALASMLYQFLLDLLCMSGGKYFITRGYTSWVG